MSLSITAMTNSNFKSNPSIDQLKALIKLNKRLQTFDLLTELFNCARFLCSGATLTFNQGVLSFSPEEMCFKFRANFPEEIGLGLTENPTAQAMSISNLAVINLLRKNNCTTFQSQLQLAAKISDDLIPNPLPPRPLQSQFDDFFKTNFQNQDDSLTYKSPPNSNNTSDD